MQLVQTMQIDYREQIAGIVARQLNGDFSDSLTRFSYVDGAEDFLRLIQSPDYLGYRREMTLIDRIMPQINQRIGYNSQIIDLGPGNGQKAIRILTYSNGQISNYTALDMSQQILNVARLSQNMHRRIHRDYRLFDFSNPIELSRELSTNSNQNRLFLLLGNTLTNEINMETFLGNLRETINLAGNGRNYLLIGIELLGQDVSQIVREYRNEENYVLTFRPLGMIGVNREDGVIDIGFNEELRRIEEQFIFTRPSIINMASNSVEFEEGDRVLLSVTYKPTLDEMMRIIRNSGCSVEEMEFEENQVMVLLSSRNDNRGGQG